MGANWLVHKFLNRCGGILADDMELGKTFQLSSCISCMRDARALTGPVLVVCPLSCAGNWIREAKRFVPHSSVAKMCGVTRERQHILDDDEVWYGMKDIIVTTYECIVSMEEFFHRHFWSALVLDEARRIKNEGSRVREAIDALECSGRILLTGTPLQNNLGELFSLLRFLWPDVLSHDSDSFERAVQMPGVFFNGQGSTMDTVVDTPLMESIRFSTCGCGKALPRGSFGSVRRSPPGHVVEGAPVFCMLARLSKLGVFVVSAGFP